MDSLEIIVVSERGMMCRAREGDEQRSGMSAVVDYLRSDHRNKKLKEAYPKKP
jgi:hypothetical protein